MKPCLWISQSLVGLVELEKRLAQFLNGLEGADEPFGAAIALGRGNPRCRCSVVALEDDPPRLSARVRHRHCGEQRLGIGLSGAGGKRQC